MKKQAKKSGIKSWNSSLSLNSKKVQLLLFVAVFGLLGGGYMVYRSFASTPCRNQVLQSGSRGECVRLFQNAVNVNQPGRLVEDGIYGSKSTLAAQDIQRFWGLVVDGKAGPKTADALCYGLANNGKSAAYCNGASAPAPKSQTSAPTSKPAPKPVLAGKCTANPEKTAIKTGELVKVGVTYTNTGTQTFRPQMSMSTKYNRVNFWRPGNKNSTSPSTDMGELKPGQTNTRWIGAYQYVDMKAQDKSVVVTFTSTNPSFSCSTTIRRV